MMALSSMMVGAGGNSGNCHYIGGIFIRIDGQLSAPSTLNIFSLEHKYAACGKDGGISWTD